MTPLIILLLQRFRMDPEKKEKFMKKAARTACWGARDEFWSCLDKQGEKVDVCKEFRGKYEEMCPPSWVVHFDRKYQYEKFKTRLKSEGYEKIDTNYGADGTRSEQKS